MPITLHKGPIGSGKTKGLLDLTFRGEGDGRSFFVARNDRHVELIRGQVLARREALLGDAILTLPKLARLMASPKGIVLARGHVAMIVLAAMTGAPLKFFRMKRPSIGVAKIFAEAILALKHSGVDAGRLAKALDTRGGEREWDLLHVFRAYEKRRMELSAVDEGDVMQMAIFGAADSGIRTVSFDEMIDPTPGELELIRAIGGCGTDVHISHPTAEKDKVYAPSFEQSLGRIEKICDDVQNLRTGTRYQPKIDIVSMRSPLQQARHIATELACHATSGGTEVVVAYSPRGPFLAHFTRECLELGISNPNEFATSSEACGFHAMFSSEEIDSWPDDAPISTFSALCEDMLEKEGTVARNSNFARQAKLYDMCPSRELAFAAKLQDALSSIAMAGALAGEKKIRREAFMDLLLREMDFGRTEFPRTFRGVEGMPIETMLPVESKRVIATDMIDGTVPVRIPDSPFFSDDDRLAKIPDPVIDEIFKTPEEALSRSAYAFDTFVCKCSGHFTACYPIIDDSGAECSRSSFLDGMGDAEPVRPIVLSEVAEAKGKDDDRVVRLADIETDRASGGDLFPEYNGRLKAPDAKAVVSRRFTEGAFSASGLEHYAECPFRFFVEKVLSLEPKEEELPELDPRDRGTVVHKILEMFFGKCSELFSRAMKGEVRREEISKKVDAIIDDVACMFPEIFSRIAEGLRPMQRRMLRTMAVQVIEMEIRSGRELSAPLFPMATEWGFGFEGVPYLEIPVAGGEAARVRGYVDRIDANAERSAFLVIDYKTGGSVDSVKADILAGMKLQLPIYVEAVRTLLLPEAAPLGGLLVDVGRAEKKHGFVKKDWNGVHYDVGRAHSSMKEEVFEQALTAAVEACARYAVAIRGGIFDVQPKKGCPRHCDYADVCRYSGKLAD